MRQVTFETLRLCFLGGYAPGCSNRNWVRLLMVCALACGQRCKGVFRREIGPAKWNLALAALLVDKAHPVLAAIFLLSESFKLSTGERVKGMGDAKVLWFYSTNACSATPLPSWRSTWRP